MQVQKTNHNNQSLVILTVKKLLHSKMMTAIFRQSMQITVDDIFGDFNDPRKNDLSKRVVIAMEDQQKRMKNQIDSNNLANLQILLKKQQQLKNLQDKLADKQEQIKQLKIRLNVSAGKLDQLQKELLKKIQILNANEQRVKSLTTSLKNLEMTVKSKEILQVALQKQKQMLLNKTEQLQNQKIKHQKIIANLRYTYTQKLEESQYILKIKQKQMEEQFTQNLSQIVVKVQKEKERQQIKNKLQQEKHQTKSQRVQCDLIINSGRESSRKRYHKQTQDEGFQTEAFEQKILEQIIAQSQKLKQPQKQLDEVRLMYSNNPKPESPTLLISNHSPKVTSYLKIITQQRQTQTDKVFISQSMEIKKSQAVQVNIKLQNDRSEQIEMYKTKMIVLKQFYESREIQYKLELHAKEQELRKIEYYKLQILELNLKIQKQFQQFSKQREILTKLNEQLENNQSQFMLRKFSSKVCTPNNKNKKSKTCSFFYRKDKGQSKLNEESYIKSSEAPPINPKQLNFISIKETPTALSPRKWEQQQADIITVIKKAHNLSFFNNKRRSVTQQSSQGNSIITNVSLARRAYRKYSNSKKL